MRSFGVAAREAASKVAIQAVRRVGRRLGQDVTPRNIYSTIPDLPPGQDPVWRKRYEEPSIDMGGQMAFIEAELGPYLGELPQGLGPAVDNGFELWNGQFMAGDAEIQYALMRHLKPRRVLELGSGFSTLVTAAAVSRNARDGSEPEFVAVDPDPRVELRAGIEGLTRLEVRDCRELETDRLLSLEPDDVLFIDTSHVVKFGSEVNWLVLEVLPRLRSGVWVHVHDIYLPYEYPRELLVATGFFNEQYLLHAFLLGNDEWEILLALSALYRGERERLARLVPSVLERRPGGLWFCPSSFWIRRRG